METKIAQKLFKLQGEVGAISKESTNPFFKSKYFDINGLISHLQPLLQKEKLLLLQPIVDGCQQSILIDIDSGEKVVSEMKLPELSDPQKLGSCVTYYRRYTLQSLLGLQAEDDDGNKASTPKDDKKWLNKGTPEFEKAKVFIADGGNLNDILKKYKMREEVKSELV
jgi:hypothetical protein